MKFQISSRLWIFPSLYLVFAGCILYGSPARAQTGMSVKDSTTVIAGPHYKRSGFYKALFGRHYRREWLTPVKVPVMMLDTAKGGLVPYQAGGGRQSRTLRLHDPQKREYVLRSIDKSFGGALPDIFRGTFLERFVDDQVTIAHPYAAVTIPGMASRAGIYHTLPVVVYIPRQPSLDSFNDDFGDRLYLFEQRPDENWESAENFGNAGKIVGTDKMLEKTLEENDHVADQHAFVRARLFDFVIGDWGRHEDQWRWAVFDTPGVKLYQPVPRDRDQAYTLFDGLLLGLVISAAGVDHYQSFGDDVRRVGPYSFPARHLDRRVTNRLSRDQWLAIADSLKNALTDDIIASAVHTMPPEVYPISGDKLVGHIRARRNNLADYAGRYYDFLAREVDVPGTSENELFKVKRTSDSEMDISIFKIAKDGNISEQPFYHRTFKRAETEEVRLYGIGGEDVVRIDGITNGSIKLRFIGGPGKDSVFDASQVNGRGHKTHVYDNSNNFFSLSDETRMHIAEDTSIHLYDYASFKYNRSKFGLGISYSNTDKLYLRAGYEFINRRWRKNPYGNAQGIYIGYSIIQNAISLIYTGDFNHIVGKWNLRLNASYDAVRWTYFHGFGNETSFDGTRRFYRLRTSEGYASLGINRFLTPRNNVSLTGFYNTVTPVIDEGRFYADVITPVDPAALQLNHFGGARLEYLFQGLNDLIVPTQGFTVAAAASYTENFKRQDKNFFQYSARMQAYFPLVADFVLALNAGVSTVDGNPEFYQYPSIGGANNLRGYVRDRFWGKTTAYSSNELQWLPNVRSYIFNGRAGLLAFYDLGRVWMPGESSDMLHTAFGGGIMLAPFDKFLLSLTYGISEENRLLHIRLGRPF